MPLFLLGRLLVTWRRPRALVAAMFTILGLFNVCLGHLDCAQFSLLLLGILDNRERPSWLLAGILCFAVVKGVNGSAMFTPNALLHGCALIVSPRLVGPYLRRREEAGGGGEASLAPLLGYGTLRERDPQEV
ncbi:hypothetical protein T492DRAFT_948087 [Pavlovales sp. CCMP2436]|nr:hypothetical protein T492DRAFT_948087 [Pavlovales sp. CCMP2436]